MPARTYTTPRFEVRFRNGTWAVFDWAQYRHVAARRTRKAAEAEAGVRNGPRQP